MNASYKCIKKSDIHEDEEYLTIKFLEKNFENMQ